MSSTGEPGDGSPARAAICYACASPLDSKAILCPVCKMWKARWRNWLPYFGGFVTVLTVVLSGATFIVSHVREMRPPYRLMVVDITSMNEGVLNVLNSGEVDILVSQIDFYCPELGMVQSYPLNQLARKHELLTLRMKTGAEGELVTPNSSDQWLKMVMEVRAKGIASGLVPAFFSQNSPLLSSIVHVENVHLASGSARIYYVPVSTGQTETLDIAPVAVVLLRKK